MRVKDMFSGLSDDKRLRAGGRTVSADVQQQQVRLRHDADAQQPTQNATSPDKTFIEACSLHVQQQYVHVQRAKGTHISLLDVD